MLDLLVLAIVLTESPAPGTPAPSATITVVVKGAIGKPGPLELHAGASLSDALAAEGIRIPDRPALKGVTLAEATQIIGRCVYGADVSRVVLVRDSVARSIDMAFGSPKRNDVVLTDGDRIFVPACGATHGKQIAQPARALPDR